MLQTKKNKISVWCKHKLSGENQCRPVHHLHKSQTCKELLPSSSCCLQILEALSSSGKILKRKEKKKVLLVKAPAVTFLHPGLVFLNTPGFVPILEKWLVGFRPNAQITSDQDSLDYQRVSVAFSFCLATAFWTSTENLDSTWKHLSAAKFQLVKDFNDSGCPLWIPILIQIFSWS